MSLSCCSVRDVTTALSVKGVDVIVTVLFFPNARSAGAVLCSYFPLRSHSLRADRPIALYCSTVDSL